MEDIIEKNPLCESMCKLFEKRNYLNGKNLEEFINKIKNDIQFKTIQNIIIDGDSLFCLLQNYIEFIKYFLNYNRNIQRFSVIKLTKF